MILVLLHLLILKTYATLDILKNDYTAYVAAVGGANGSVIEGVYALNYNPAGLAFSNKLEATLSASNGFDDATYSYIGAGFQIPHRILSEFSYPHTAFSIYLSNLGRMIERTLDENGNITEKRLNAEKDIIVSIGYAEKLSKETVYISPSVKSTFESAAGITFKFINSTLLDRYKANTIAVDAGYLGSLNDIGLKFGLSISNSFGKIRYYKEQYKLPQIIRAGISYSRPTIFENKTTFLTEYTTYPTQKQQSLRLGIDYTIENAFSFRVGYKLLEDNKGLTLGIGIHMGGFYLDISTAFTSVYKYSFLSVTYKMLGETKSPQMKRSHQLDRFKEKQQEKTPPSPSKEKVIIVF